MANRGSKLTVGALMSLAVLLVAAGCEQTVPKAKYDQLESDNAKVRADLATANGNLDRAQNDNRSLAGQIDALNKQNALLQQQLAAVPARPTPPGPTPPGPAAPGPEDEFGPGTTVHRTANALTIDIEGDVLFDSGKDKLKADDMTTLNRIAQVLKGKYATNTIRVVGHTDSDPIKVSKWPSNEALSKARAQEVADYLAKHGVKSKLDVEGVGASDPKVSPEKSKADKAQNRRVIVQVLLKS